MPSSTLVVGLALLALPLSLAPGASSARLSLFTPARAQTSGSLGGKTFSPAPVPGVAPPGLSRAERFNNATAGSINAPGPANSTPFSGVPSGTIPEVGTTTARADQTLTRGNAGVATPNVSR